VTEKNSVKKWRKVFENCIKRVYNAPAEEGRSLVIGGQEEKEV
jgi:hypothetical protein